MRIQEHLPPKRRGRANQSEARAPGANTQEPMTTDDTATTVASINTLLEKRGDGGHKELYINWLQNQLDLSESNAADAINQYCQLEEDNCGSTVVVGLTDEYQRIAQSN